MKKIGLLIKEISESNIKNTIKESNAVFIIRYSGLSSPHLTALRKNLKNSKANLFVTKNSVARRALAGSGLETLVKSVEGPCGLIFVKDEPVDVSKVLYNFSKDHEQLKLEGGVLKDPQVQVLEKKDIESMAQIPSRDVLRAQLVMALNSPISGIVITLNQIIAKFVYCLEQIKQKKTT